MLILQFLFFIFNIFSLNATSSSDLELELVQVLFRHGDRTPQPWETYPKDINSAINYEPYGFSQLTNTGKLREYKIGRLLRNMYGSNGRYGKFLNDLYNPEEVYARSTDTDRTKMSTELVLAGLYPVTSQTQWNNNIFWSPIPLHFTQRLIDNVFYDYDCSEYTKEHSRVEKLPEILKKLNQHQEFEKYITKNTGLKIKSAHDYSNLYYTLESQLAMNLTMPDWCDSATMKTLQDMLLLDYEVDSHTLLLKRLHGGQLIKKFIKNMNIDGSQKDSKKIFLYGGHDTTLAGFARALGIDFLLPRYGSAIIVEKLRNKNNKIFINIIVYSGVSEKILPSKLPGCDRLCPVENFLEILNPVIPSDEELRCKIKELNEKDLENSLNEV